MNYRIAATANSLEELRYAENHEGVNLAEIKFDDIRKDGKYDLGLFKEAEERDLEVIATFPRPAEQEGKKYTINNTTLELLKKIASIADYMDIELNNTDYSPTSDEEYLRRRDEHIETAHNLGLDVIVSWHDYDSTPSLEELEGKRDKEIQGGADIAKICTTAEVLQDNTTVLKLLESSNHPMLAWAMGERGVFSRYLSPYRGGEWVFGSIGEKSAPGQLPMDDVYSDFANLRERSVEALLEPFSEYDYAMSVK